MEKILSTFLLTPYINGLCFEISPIIILENFFLYFSSKTYVVGTQKNHLNETVLLSTQNIRLN